MLQKHWGGVFQFGSTRRQSARSCEGLVRVIHILDHSLPLQSGYVFRTLGILSGQRELGWQTIHLTTPRHNDWDKSWNGESEIEVDGWLFHRSPAISGVPPIVREMAQMRATRERLDALVRQERPDILHAHSPCLDGLPALSVGRKYGIPVIYEVRALWEDAAVSSGVTRQGSLRYQATRMLETHVMRRADALIVICEGLRRDLISRGIPAEKVTIVPNAVDVSAFPGAASPDAELSQRLGLAGRTVIGFIGSFYHYEGLDLLVRAIPLIARDYPGVRLLLVGGGPEENQLRDLVKTQGIEDMVVMTGRVPFAEVQKYYDVADLLVYPRRKIRLTDIVTPLKPLEAMAQGRVLAASDIGGHRELIDDARTGFLFPPDSVEAIAAGVVRALASRSTWHQIQASAREFVETKRNWKASVANYIPVYERLTSNATPRAERHFRSS
jgi:PEP-CTERM/exosortase A-associated glycosyltransferase